jgi:hypothetical protein
VPASTPAGPRSRRHWRWRSKRPRRRRSPGHRRRRPPRPAG